jgi:hypothetical protein
VVFLALKSTTSLHVYLGHGSFRGHFCEGREPRLPTVCLGLRPTPLLLHRVVMVVGRPLARGTPIGRDQQVRGSKLRQDGLRNHKTPTLYWSGCPNGSSPVLPIIDLAHLLARNVGLRFTGSRWEITRCLRFAYELYRMAHAQACCTVMTVGVERRRLGGRRKVRPSATIQR